METVFIGFGSNLGDQHRNCCRAIELLADHADCTVHIVSPFYLTEPFGPVHQDWFTNGILKLDTTLSPVQLLTLCKNIEKELHRIPTEPWGPRIIDLDILIWLDRVLVSGKLRIPHPQMHLRRFVLKPFSDIAPQLRHPFLGSTIQHLLNTLSDPLKVIPLENPGKD